MKNLYIYLAILLLAASQVKAADDAFTDDLLLGDTPGTSNSSQTQDKTDVSSSDDEEESLGRTVINIIKKPLSLFFSAEDEVVKEDGTKETYLEKSTRLAEEGSLEDQMNLAYMYLYGTNGVEQDTQKAIKYYDMAAQQDDAVALNNLGSLYFSGIGTPRDVKKALVLFSKSAELGNDNAAVNLAFIYLTGGTKSSLRNTKAVELFQQASKKGNNIAKFMLGYAYYRGFIVTKDYNKAYKLIKSVAKDEVKIDEAQLVMAEMNVYGYGTVQNYQNAVNYYRGAVGQGNQEAIMKLANIYIEGKISPVNLVIAHALYNIAASQNIAGAAEKRDAIAENLKLEQLTEAQRQAQEYKSSPSELTQYIRQTYGTDIRNYIDINMQ